MDVVSNGLTTASTRSLRVIIIGAGFSGTMVAVHLLRQDASVQIDIVDDRLPGRGLAYSTVYDQHLLNVPAIRMSAFGGEPQHFLDWLHAHGMPSADTGMFAPRKFYGTYVQDVLQTTARSAGATARLRHHMTEAVRVSFDGLSANVFLRNGERLEAEKVILALGNPPSRRLSDLPGYFGSPWETDALANLAPDKSVLLVGAGLTGVDAFLALLAQGHVGEIHMLSRRGKLPQVHAPYRPLPNPFPLPGRVSARALLNKIRSAVRKAQAEGVDWRAVIDSLRPVTNEIWQQLEPQEQRRIFRHLKTWWDIHRHRMAAEIGAKVEDAIERRQLIVHAGRLKSLSLSESGLHADIQSRTGSAISLDVARVIACTGADDDYRATQNPLIRSLLDSGYATPTQVGKGLATAPQGELIDVEARQLDWLLALGPLRIGNLFETVAVPELRKQAESLANRLLSISREPVEVTPELFLAAGI